MVTAVKNDPRETLQIIQQKFFSRKMLERKINKTPLGRWTTVLFLIFS